MAKSKQQGSEKNQQQNADKENPEGKNLPIPMGPPETVPNNKRDVVGITDVNPDEVAKNVPYEDSGDSEAGLPDDDV